LTSGPSEMSDGEDWIPLEDFIAAQVADALAWMDSIIDEHEGAEREAMLRKRPQVAAKIEAQVRLAYAHLGGARH
jgi:hypothetical protein